MMMILLTLFFDALVMLVSIKLISGKDDEELSIPKGMAISLVVAVVTIVLLVVLVGALGAIGIPLAVIGGSFVLGLAIIKAFDVEPSKAWIIAAIFFAVKLIREYAYIMAVGLPVNDETASLVDAAKVLLA